MKKIKILLLITLFFVSAQAINALDVTGDITVTVNAPVTYYTVTPSAGTNGTISPDTPQTVEYDSTVSFTVTPKAGYTASVEGTCGGSLSENTYTTNKITADCTVVASFTSNTYKVSTSAETGCTISPASRTVTSGNTTTFTVTPDSGYNISSTSGCGGSLSGTTYTTGKITEACTVSASCSLITYTVSTSCGTGCSWSPTSATVNASSTTSFTMTVDEGYDSPTASGCGGSLSGTTYTTGAINSDCTVTGSVVASSCPAPLTREVKVACDPKDGVDATSGEVTRKQTKEFPSCTFGEPITVDNSTYVSDNCVYPGNSFCSEPNDTNYNIGECSGICKNGAINYPTCNIFDPMVDGYWTYWSPDISTCPQTLNQTRTCIPPQNGGKDCQPDAYGMDTTRSITFNNCPSVNMDVTYAGISVKNYASSNQKVPYSSKVKATWNSSNASSGCECTYSDSKSSGSCGNGTTGNFTSGALKRDTTYTVKCTGDYGIQVQSNVIVPVSPISADYEEH